MQLPKVLCRSGTMHRDNTLMYDRVKTTMTTRPLLLELASILSSEERGEVARRKEPGDDSFGERLRRLRTASGFTQQELADAAGTSQRMIAYYETHSGTPAAPVLLKIASALKVKPEELMGLKAEQEASRVSSPQNLRLWRKLRKVEKLSPADRRQVLQLIDALFERNALRKQRGA
jgi:transcriptional regulator with XRE-family HTH domain